VVLHDRKGRAAAHEVAAVRPSGVVVLEPALELGVEVGQAGECWRSSGEVAEPEGSVFGLGCEDAGGGGGELGQAAEPMTPQELLDTGGRQADPAVGKVVDQTLGADGGSGDRLGQHRLDLVRRGRGRHDRWPATLGQ
jgi:hypothetical protein